MVKQYVVFQNDAPQETSSKGGLCLPSLSSLLPACVVPTAAAAPVWRCELCEVKPFSSNKALEQHKCVKHGSWVAVGALVPDISVCPVCDTNFWSRHRLVGHLSETRVRSRVRATTCNAELRKMWQVGAWKVDPVEVADLEAQRRSELRNAQRRGSSHVPAVLPARRGKPSVLKGRPAGDRRDLPRRRVRSKSSIVAIAAARSQFPLVVAKPPKYLCASTSFSFGRDDGSAGGTSLIDPAIALARPFKIRRVGAKCSDPVVRIARLMTAHR